MTIVICAHAGAWNTQDPAAIQTELNLVKEAVAHSKKSNSALEAALAAIEVLENHPELDAGYGSILQMDGEARTDAAIATNDSRFKKNYASLLQLRRIKNPSKLAHRLLEYGYHSILSGEYALKFAEEEGFVAENLVTERRKMAWLKQLKEFHLSAGQIPPFAALAKSQAALDAKKLSTVGVLSADMDQKLVYAISSTGGLYYGYPGRVADSALFGQGIYTDQNMAVICTGEGDKITQRMTAMRTANFYEQTQDIQKSVDLAVADLKEFQAGECGILAIDLQGRVGIAKSTLFLACAQADFTPGA